MGRFRKVNVTRSADRAARCARCGWRAVGLLRLVRVRHIDVGECGFPVGADGVGSGAHRVVVVRGSVVRHDPSTHRGFTSEPRGWAVGFTTVTDRGSGLVSVRTAPTRVGLSVR